MRRRWPGPLRALGGPGGPYNRSVMWRRIGFDGSVGAARAAAALFLLAGILAVLGMAQPHSRPRDLLVVAVADFGIAAAAWWVPWEGLHPRATVALAVAGLAVLAFSTWA